MTWVGGIPEIDIWRAATLMLKRYGDKALEQSDRRADADKVQARFNNGILEIELQRLEADRPKKIEIRAV